MYFFTAWRKGDLIKMPNGKQFRLTSDAYEIKPGKYYCDTDRGKPIKYLKLMKKAYLIETGSGIKNIKY